MMSGHVYYQSEKSASQFDDDWLCPVLNGEKEEKEVPKSICSALHSSELEANKKSDQENMSDSESQSEDDNDSLIFSGNDGEDINGFLLEIDMLVQDNWNKSWDENAKERDYFKAKECYDVLMNHLSEFPRLIAKNEEHDYRKAVSELYFRYGEPHTVVNGTIEMIEYHTRSSMLCQPDERNYGYAESMEYVKYQLSNLKQMAARDETYRKLIQDEPKNADRIVSLMPEEMEARFVDVVLNKLSLHDKNYNSKHFNMLIDFLVDELPNIGEEQHSECYVFESNASSRKLEEDVDLQLDSEADSDDDP